MSVDRLPGEWHKLHPDESESAFMEAAGAFAGTFMGQGYDSPRWTETFIAAFRHATETAFCWGYSAAKREATTQTDGGTQA